MRSSRPTVSIGMPVFNGERFVAEAVESVLFQGFDDWELIISDNGSTDATVQICREFAERDSRIQLVVSPINRGAAWNFNRVLQLSSGTYFKWLAADDYCAPEFLATAVAALDANPGAVLAYSPAVFVDALGAPLEQAPLPKLNDRLSRNPKARVGTYIQGVVHDGKTAQILIFGLIRRSALMRTRPLGHYFAADCTLVLELLLSGPVARLVPGLSFVRRHESASSFGAKARDRVFQQHFYNPRITGRARSTLNHYRVYGELPWAIVRSPLPIVTRCRLASSTVLVECRFLAPRIVTRLRNGVAGAVQSGPASRLLSGLH